MERRCEKIEILISPMVYKDKVAFFTSYISYMEYNENPKKQNEKS